MTENGCIPSLRDASQEERLSNGPSVKATPCKNHGDEDINHPALDSTSSSISSIGCQFLIKEEKEENMKLTSLKKIVQSAYYSTWDDDDSSERNGPFVLRVIHLPKDYDGPHDVQFQDHQENIAKSRKRHQNTHQSNDCSVRDPKKSTCKQPLPVLISDGTNYCAGLILHPTEEVEVVHDICVSITGIIVGYWRPMSNSTTTRRQQMLAILRETQASTFEASQSKLPFLYITRFQVLSDKESLVYEQKTNRVDKEATSGENKVSSNRDWAFPNGVVSQVLASDKFDTDMLMGPSSQPIAHVLPCETDTHSIIEINAKTVEDFLEQHFVVMLLSNQERGHLGPAGSLLSLAVQGSTQQSMQNYHTSLLEFDRKQQEKEVESIRQAIDDLEPKKLQTTVQFKETLQYSPMCKDESLTSKLCIRWHLWLMGDGLHKEAGKFRDYTRRNGGKELCPPNQIPNRLRKFCRALESQWFPRIKSKLRDSKKIVSFAAAAMIGILDIYPFHDGNHRFGLIVLNWALRRCGVPFCIHRCGEEEKQDWKSILDATIQNLYHIPLGKVEDTDTIRVLNSAGGLSPLVSFLLRRMAFAFIDLSVVIGEKAKWTTEEHNARIVRKAREAAVETVCFVCFEEQPNISTLLRKTSPFQLLGSMD
jgi:fido (protein-threonine AMPylation protein)